MQLFSALKVLLFGPNKGNCCFKILQIKKSFPKCHYNNVSTLLHKQINSSISTKLEKQLRHIREAPFVDSSVTTAEGSDPALTFLKSEEVDSLTDSELNFLVEHLKWLSSVRVGPLHVPVLSSHLPISTFRVWCKTRHVVPFLGKSTNHKNFT